MLYAHHNIEIPIKKFNNRLYIRLSINIYNTAKNIDDFLSVTKNIINTYCDNEEIHLT
jgi:selenocysteine lyase/cysteine desulfurase